MSEFLNTGDQPPATTETPKVEATQVKAGDYTNLLAAITNPEGKQKYDTVEKALIGLANSQNHIQKIEGENGELRGVLQEVETLKQLIQRLEKGTDTDRTPKPVIEDPEKLVSTVIEKREAAMRLQSNKEQVYNALRERFGDKTDEVLEAKAKDLGMGLGDLGSLAAKSPKAVLDLFGQKPVAPAVQSTVNPQALTPRGDDLTPPENIMIGASTKDLVGYWRKIVADVNKQNGLT